MPTVAIITARMTSSRLPGKVLKPINGIPALAYMIRRLEPARLIDEVIIASTSNNQDQPVHELANSLNVRSFAGSEHDVLGRLLGAARFAGADTIVYLTGDCPLIDPVVVDRVVSCYQASGADFASNTLRRSYVRGMDCEVFSLQLLKRLDAELFDAWDREHVTEHIYLRPTRYKIAHHETTDERARLPRAQVCLDNPEDLELITLLDHELGGLASHFTATDIASYLKEHPSERDLNEQTRKKHYRVGISGLGRVAWNGRDSTVQARHWSHIEALGLMPDATVVAAYDPDESKCAGLQAQMPDVRIATSLEEMLQNYAIDILYICSPTPQHHRDLETALSSDVSAVMCEKPLDSDFARAESLVARYDERGIPLFINYWPRWSEPFEIARQYIQRQQLGAVRSVSYHYPQGLMNSGSYGIDQLRGLFGEISQVSALNLVETGRTDDPGISATLKFESGLSAFLVALDGRQHLTNELDIIGDLGRLRIIDNGHLLEYWHAHPMPYLGQTRNQLELSNTYRASDVSPFPVLAQHIVNHLRFGRPILCNGHDGAAATRVCNAIVKSWKKGGQPVIMENLP